MGGVSVFSIEQDTREARLEAAIWDVGGMAPLAEDIAQGQWRFPISASLLMHQFVAVSGNVLTDSGDIDLSYFVCILQKSPWNVLLTHALGKCLINVGK